MVNSLQAVSMPRVNSQQATAFQTSVLPVQTGTTTGGIDISELMNLMITMMIVMMMMKMMSNMMTGVV